MGVMDSIKNAAARITNKPPPEPETLPQSLLRQVDEATTLTWKQVWHSSKFAASQADFASFHLACLCRGQLGLAYAFA